MNNNTAAIPNIGKTLAIGLGFKDCRPIKTQKSPEPNCEGNIFLIFQKNKLTIMIPINHSMNSMGLVSELTTIKHNPA